jgi:hypothetical protein
MLRIGTVIACVLGLASVGFAANPDPKSLAISPEDLSRARALVQQLGSEQFLERERAEQALVGMGRLARPALLEAVNSDPNPEVRNRCSLLLPKANALDLKARLEVFLADVDGRYEHDLPGWNEFRAVIRNEWTLLGHVVWSDPSLDKPARAVFAELVASPENRALLLAANESRAELGQQVAARRQELYNQKVRRTTVVNGMVITSPVRREPTTADLATLLFAESLVPSRFVPRTAAMSTLLANSSFTRDVKESDAAARVYRAIATAWLESRQDPVEMYQAMTIARSFNLPDQTVRLAVRLLNDRGATPSYRGLAATQLAQVGTKEHIPLMEKLMQETTVLTTVARSVVKDGRNEIQRFEIQVRDVGLAVSVLLSGQKLEDYGFVDLIANPGGVATYSYTRQYLPEDKREAAFRKWAEWRAKNP